jgi:hypothetical protein
MRHFGKAEQLAKRFLARSHSNEQSGAGQEDIPAWVAAFRRYFDSQLDNPSASALAAEARVNNRSIVRGLIRGQAPLGRHDSNNPVVLRTETDSNIGGQQQQQMVGHFESRVHDQEELINILQQPQNRNAGMNDVVQQPQQQQQQPQQDTSQPRPVPQRLGARTPVTRRRNTHNPLEQFSMPHQNYSSMDQGLFSLGRLTEVVARAFENPPLGPARTMMNAAEDLNRVTALLNATPPEDTLLIRANSAARQFFLDEIESFTAAASRAEIEPRNDESGSTND